MHACWKDKLSLQRVPKMPYSTCGWGCVCVKAIAVCFKYIYNSIICAKSAKCASVMQPVRVWSLVQGWQHWDLNPEPLGWESNTRTTHRSCPCFSKGYKKSATSGYKTIGPAFYWLLWLKRRLVWPRPSHWLPENPMCPGFKLIILYFTLTVMYTRLRFAGCHPLYGLAECAMYAGFSRHNIMWR